MLTRIRAARHGEDGMTLMELMVAMAVSAILAVMAGYFFIGTSTTSTAATEQSLQNSQIRDALQQWTQLIRVADSPSQPGTTSGRITVASPTTLTFYAAVGNRTGTTAAGGLSTVTLSIGGGVLRQTIVDPSNNSSSQILFGCTNANVTGCVSKTRVAAGRFVPYYTGTGCPAASVAPGGMCIIDPAASPSLDDILAVGITVSAAGVTGPGHTAAQTYSTLVTVGSAT